MSEHPPTKDLTTIAAPTQAQTRRYVPLADQQDRPPDCFPVSVLVRVTPVTDHPWLRERRQFVGIVLAQTATQARAADDAAAADHLLRIDGLTLRLFADEAESYYHNLTVEAPRCFLVSRPDADGRLQPFLVTASFDQANAYFEGDEQVDALPMPAALCQALERFVLTHYVPTERKKRKRKQWVEP